MATAPENLEIIPDLPSPLAAAFGRAVYKFSVLEDKLRSLLYALAGVDHVRGRLLIRDTRAEQMFDLILEMLQLHDLRISLSPGQLRRIAEDIKRCNGRRDLLAHGVAAVRPGDETPILVRERGSWTPPPGPGEPTRKVKRAIRPEGVPLRPEDCHLLIREIDGLIITIDGLGAALNEWRASQHIST